MKWYQRKFFRVLGKIVKTVFWFAVNQEIKKIENKIEDKK
jgi:hypothetical protein